MSMNMSFEEVLNQYNGDILKLAKRYALLSKGSDVDDFYSVGMLGFYKAVNSYDENYNATIRTYAYKCCKQEMHNLIRRDFRKKQIKDIVHIEAFETPDNVCGYIEDDYSNLERVTSEELMEIFSLFKTILTEKQCIIFYRRIMQDKKLAEIADEFNITKQAVQASISSSITKIKKNPDIANKILDLC